jgi:CRISPR-associated protein Csd2
MKNPYLADKLGFALPFPEEHIIHDHTKRHDFIFLFDAAKCNPNGDPDNDNMPRQDFESRTGIVTGPCLKRKIRDFMAQIYETERSNSTKTMNLYVKHRGLLKDEHSTVAAALRKGGNDHPSIDDAQTAMRAFYWDVRMFGAVLTVGKENVDESTPMDGLTDVGSPSNTPPPVLDKKTGKTKKEHVLNGGQCVGCVSIGMAETIEEITPGLMSIVRDARVENEAKDSDEQWATSAMPGNLPWMPYGLYKGLGHFSPNLDRSGVVTREDLAILWNGLRRMFENDNSAARPAGSMKALAAWVFTHDHKLGNYPVHKLFERISVSRSCEQNNGNGEPARSYRDYTVNVDWTPGAIAGVTLTTLYNDWDG